MRPSLPVVIALAVANLFSAAAKAQNPTDPPQGQHAILTVLGNLFADVAIAAADPRVRLD